jgi:hypothetical protein
MAQSAAAAITITFDAGFGFTPSYTEQGVTFTTVDGQDLWASTSPNGTNALLSNSDAQGNLSPIRADFDTAVDFLSLQLGDFAADMDIIFLRVYDASDNLLAESTDSLPPSLSGFKTLDVTVSGIKYAIFGGSGAVGSSVYADNFTTDPTFNPPGTGTGGGPGPTVVPEPAAWALMLAGFGLVGTIARRRSLSAQPR